MDQTATPSDAAPVAESSSLEDRILSKLGGVDATPEASPQETSQPQGDSEEVQIEDENPQQVVDTVEDFEMVHNGQSLKVSREKAKEYAQKGYDYDFKMQRVNGEYEKVKSMAGAIQARESMNAQALDAMAEIKAIEKQLAPYVNVDWAQYGNSDPVLAYQHRLQYEALRDGYQQAVGKVNDALQKAQQASQKIDHEQIALEKTRVLEKIPQWRDPAVAQKESGEIIQGLQKDYGLTAQELQHNAWLLNDHRVLALMRDAYKYRQAVSTQKAKKGQLQGLPQVSKPGARQDAPSAMQNVANIKRGLHQPNVSKEQRKVLTDNLIAAKFGIK